MAHLTIPNLEKDIKNMLCDQAEKHGHSMEEEARQILIATLEQKVNSSSQISARKSPEQKWLDELEQRGVLVKARNPSGQYKPGKPVAGVLERFLAERHG